MVKRILIALALAASLGGAVAACNSPSGTTTPAGSTGTLPTIAPSLGTETSPSTGTEMSPSTGTESAAPSAS